MTRELNRCGNADEGELDPESFRVASFFDALDHYPFTSVCRTLGIPELRHRLLSREREIQKEVLQLTLEHGEREYGESEV